MFRLSVGVAAGVLLAAPVAATAQTAVPAQTQTINTAIAEKWEEAGIKKPLLKKSADLEFLRRVFIDLIGRIPSTEEVKDFEADMTPDKRARLVKRLLYADKYTPKVNGAVPMVSGADGKKVPLTFNYADEYAEHWSNIWTVWLMTRSGHPLYREQMGLWLKSHFKKNTPYNEIVTQLLTATGKSNENPAVNFIAHHLGDNVPPERQAELGKFDAVPVTSRVTKLFLGLQTQCTQCHDHPFNKEWVQSDFWGVNAYFRQVTRDRNPTPGTGQMMANPVQVAVTDDTSFNPTGVVFYERRDGKLMAQKPNFLKDYEDALNEKTSIKTMAAAASAGVPGKTRREVLAHYVTRHDNFAKAYVSRMWGHLFGRGLNKEPSIDDFGSNNETVHADLLNKVGEDWAKYGYDPKMLLEWICNSDVYQLSHVAVPAYADQKYDPYFARMPLKSMSPEVLFESIMTASRAEMIPAQMLDEAAKKEMEERRERWMNRLVRNFGDDEGNEMTFNGTVIQALLMMNGQDLNAEVNRAAGNAVATVVARNTKAGVTSPAKVIDELFVMTVGRHPTPAEVGTLLEFQKGTRKVTVEVETPEWTGPAAKPGPKPKPGAKPAVPAKPAKEPEPKKVTGTLPGAAPNDVKFYQDIFWALLNTNEFILNH